MKRFLIIASFIAGLSTVGRAAERADSEPACCATVPGSQRPEDQQFLAEGPAAFFARLFDTTDYPARWYCGSWALDVGWLHILSDLAIFAAYLAIPLVLLFFMLRRRDLPFPRILWLFAAFIFACGLGHLLEATIFWWPAYRFAGLVKGMTAVVSWATVIALVQVVPQALALPALAVANRRLEAEVVQQRAAQKRLEQSYEELEKITDMAMDRESRVIELKKEVNSLLASQGHEAHYVVAEQTP